MNHCDHDFEEVSAIGDSGKSYMCTLCSYTYREDPYQSPCTFINHYGLAIAQYTLRNYEENQNLVYMDWILTEKEVDVLKMLVKSYELVVRMDGLEACQRILDNAPEKAVGYHTMHEGYFRASESHYYMNLNHCYLDKLQIAVDHVNKILSYKVN